MVRFGQLAVAEARQILEPLASRFRATSPKQSARGSLSSKQLRSRCAWSDNAVATRPIGLRSPLRSARLPRFGFSQAPAPSASSSQTLGIYSPIGYSASQLRSRSAFRLPFPAVFGRHPAGAPANARMRSLGSCRKPTVAKLRSLWRSVPPPWHRLLARGCAHPAQAGCVENRDHTCRVRFAVAPGRDRSSMLFGALAGLTMGSVRM